jgi:pimeloyl-ACP methyl ester carboxylesterase
VIRQAGSISIPVLLVYGGQDPYVTRSQIDCLQKRIKGNVTLQYVADAVHRGIDDIYPDQYMHWLIEFFSIL